MRPFTVCWSLCFFLLFPFSDGSPVLYPNSDPVDLALRLEECQIQKRTLIMTHQYQQMQLQIAAQHQHAHQETLKQYIQSLETTVDIQRQMIAHLSRSPDC